MKATSYLIMWLTIFLVLILAMILALVLLLLAELYCSPFVRRHRRRHLPPPTATTTTVTTPSPHSPSPLTTHTTDIEKQLPDPMPENQETGGTQNGCLMDSVNGSSLVYISNPIYGNGNGTPFETPESSPSRLETEDDDDDEREEVSSKVVVTPPVKKLPVAALGTSGSDTNGVSSSCWSLTTPCTSPSL